jgi:hypothetical protein
MDTSNTQSIRRPSLALLCAEPLRAASEFARSKLGRTESGTPGVGHLVVIFPRLATHPS